MINGTLKQILTPKRFQYARLVREGLTNRQIAEQLRVAEISVSQRLAQIYSKAGCSARTGHGGYLPRVELATRFAVEEYAGMYQEAK